MGEPIARHLIERGYRLTGMDAAPGMIELCRKRFPGHEWIVGDMRATVLGRTFDGVIAWDSFFHLTPADQARTMARFSEHAAPGSALMFTSGPSRSIAIGWWQGARLYHASLDPDDYRGLLEAAGFELLSFVPEDPACDRHSVWLALRRPGRPET